MISPVSKKDQGGKDDPGLNVTIRRKETILTDTKSTQEIFPTKTSARYGKGRFLDEVRMLVGSMSRRDMEQKRHQTVKNIERASIRRERKNTAMVR